MELLNIYPLKNQSFYKDESMVMILSHLLPYYNKDNFNKNQYIIMDNGLYEGSQSSIYLDDLIDMVEESGLPISEIVIPDVFFDKEGTIRLFEMNLKTLKKYSGKYTFMFVAQSSNIDEFEEIIDYINQYSDYLTLSVGVPKKAPFSRESNRAISIYKKCLFPIHFLGVADNTPLKNLRKVKNLIRSCDTSQICTMIKNNKRDVLNYTRSQSDSVIDLKEDCIASDDLIKALKDIKNAI